MKGEAGGRHALLVAAGIFASRVAGFVRQAAFAHYFGTSPAADAFNAAFRIPNFLQNLFGEGALSASFIPVYARLVAGPDPARADRIAGAIGAMLAVTTAVIVGVGVLAAPWLVAGIAPGFTGDTEALTVRLVRILFPGAGLLVMSAWCLGILNSHRRFFLSYAAPVVWNAAMIGALVAFGARSSQDVLAGWLAGASVLGSLLQCLVQVPMLRAVAPALRFGWSSVDPDVALVVRNFGPALLGRGVVQISAYVDQILASWLPAGSVATLSYAQTLYTLPVSLFGMAVSAAELPAMSAAGVDHEALRIRLNAGLARVAYFVVPSAVAFLALGDVVAQALFQTGSFGVDDARRVWAALAGSSVGLLAGTLGRLYASAFYATGDPKAPLRFAAIRVGLTTVLGALGALWLPARLGLDPSWGLPGLTLASGLAGWVEFALLQRALNGRIGATQVGWGRLAAVFSAATAAAMAGWAVKLAVPVQQPQLLAVAVFGAYGVIYLGLTWVFGLPEPLQVLRRLRR